MKIEIYFYKKGYRVTDSGSVINPKGETISGYKHRNGYFGINAKIDSKDVTCNVHRVQAFQKYGMDLYEEGIVVRHLDGNKENNSFDNIAIGTYSDNRMDIPEHIRMRTALYATSFTRKYDKTEVKEFHENNGRSYKKTMEYFGITSKGTLHYILNK